MIGVLTSACPAIKYGWLYTKAMEREKFLTLNQNNGCFDAIMAVPRLSEFSWWLYNIHHGFNEIKQDSFQLEIFKDASLTGWGAYFAGERTHGWWTENDRHSHINMLELEAIFMGLRCFAKNTRNANILIRCDNTTATACINRMGSVQHQHLNTLTKKVWQWCQGRNLWLPAAYINTKDNWQADEESRALKPETEWSLASFAFSRIVKEFGKPKPFRFKRQF